MMHVACKYAPAELLRGFGEQVERLDPNPASFTCADGCAHPNLCGFAKAVIQEAHERDLAGLVLTDCCDAMRRAYDVLADRGTKGLHFIALPHKAGEAETALFAGELRRLAEEVGAQAGAAFSWERALAACDEAAADPALRQREAADPHVSLMGAHGGSLLLERVRDAFPGTAVHDGTCSAGRAFDPALVRADRPADEDGFFPWYARLLLRGLPPCMRMQHEPRDPQAIAGAGARGIVYHTMKFCDYYSFEYAGLKDAAAVPLLKVETDATPQSSGQLRTRIQAFAETLGVTAMTGGQTEARGAARYVAGIDSGSTSTDAVVMGTDGAILGSAIVETGMSASASAQAALDQALAQAGLSTAQVDRIIATGYGRDALAMADSTVTEITCHARGARHLFPEARTIIDIGGQDSKVIRIDGTGNVAAFAMNDKCAAGTGRFLEAQARVLGLTMDEMGTAGLSWKGEAVISSMCTVFAESEVVSLVARDTPLADIVHGLNSSVAAKTKSLVARAGGGDDGAPFAMTGGVSRNPGVVQCLSEQLGAPVATSPLSQLCGAVGAALMALG